MFKKLLTILTLTLFLCGCATASNKTPIFTSHKKPIIVSQQNPTFTITQQSNPTTGFSWKLISYDKNLMTFVSHKYVPPENKKLMGAPGYEVWTFTAVKPTVPYAVNQVGHIRMEYARPWTQQQVTKRNFVVIVKAK